MMKEPAKQLRYLSEGVENDEKQPCRECNDPTVFEQNIPGNDYPPAEDPHHPEVAGSADSVLKLHLY